MSHLKDVAASCGVSINTVSDIVNRGKQDLYGATTVEKVKKAARELGYRANRSAQAMRSNRTRNIGFVVLNRSQRNFGFNQELYPFSIGMTHHFIPQGYHLSMMEYSAQGANSIDKFVELLRERFFDAIVVHVDGEMASFEFIKDLDIPVIYYDCGLFEKYNCLGRDESAVAQNLMLEMIGMGHRRIGIYVDHYNWQDYCAGTYVHYSYKDCVDMYRQIMDQYKLDSVFIHGFDSNEIAKTIKENQLTAVVGRNDTDWLFLTMMAANRLGYQFPGDLSFGNFCHCGTGYELSFQSGGISYDRYAAGKMAAEMVFEALASKTSKAKSRTFTGDFRCGNTIVNVGMEDGN